MQTNHRPRALIIEDNPKIAQGIAECLTEAGFGCEQCLSGLEGEQRAVATPYNVIILDVLLPDADGIEICKRLRGKGVATPVIMLTALGTTEDKIAGLDVGADDFLAKPFKTTELVARVRAILRRTEATETHALRCDDLELDTHKRRLTRAGESYQLASREFDLIRHMMLNQNRVLSREQIGERVWGMEFEPSSNVIDVYISTLRKKIDRPGLRTLIHTIKNEGYRLGIVD